MNKDLLSQAATIARGLAIDAVHACSSGHLGLPLGTAEIGAVLFGHALQYNPAEPRWINRDRFVLSAGHGSMFLYGWLHLAGYDLPLDEIKNFRQLHSRLRDIPSSVRRRVWRPRRDRSAKASATPSVMRSAARCCGAVQYARPDDFRSPCHRSRRRRLSAGRRRSEAAALAGHLGLDNLILIYDSNDVTLDAMAEVTQSEDTAQRFEAYGFDVQTVDGHDMQAVAAGL